LKLWSWEGSPTVWCWRRGTASAVTGFVRLSEARNAGGVGASGNAADGGEARTAGAGRGRAAPDPARRGRLESPWPRGSTARPTRARRRGRSTTVPAAWWRRSVGRGARSRAMVEARRGRCPGVASRRCHDWRTRRGSCNARCGMARRERSSAVGERELVRRPGRWGWVAWRPTAALLRPVKQEARKEERRLMEESAAASPLIALRPRVLGVLVVHALDGTAAATWHPSGGVGR
jgi:hypothetical protein